MSRPSGPGIVALSSIAIGTSAVVYNMLNWQFNQVGYGSVRNGASVVFSFYEAEFLGVLMLLLGLSLIHISEPTRP